MAGWCEAKIGPEFFVNIFQRGRRINPRFHRKAQPVSLVGAMIGILAKYDHFGLVKRNQVQSSKVFGALGENSFLFLILGAEKAALFDHVGLGELVGKPYFPGRFQFDWRLRLICRFHGPAPSLG